MGFVLIIMLKRVSYHENAPCIHKRPNVRYYVHNNDALMSKHFQNIGLIKNHSLHIVHHSSSLHEGLLHDAPKKVHMHTIFNKGHL